jgi:hypothetical protein
VRIRRLADVSRLHVALDGASTDKNATSSSTGRSSTASDVGEQARASKATDTWGNGMNEGEGWGC